MLPHRFTSRQTRLLGVLLAFSALVTARASFEGIPENILIRDMSRPCCSFTRSDILRRMGITATIDPKDLGEHHFGRATGEDAVGILYSCRSGFVDVSHLRDNADWAATIYRALLRNLGRGVSLEVQKEVPFAAFTLELPKLPVNTVKNFSREDIALMAISLTFDLGVHHEMATFFQQTVSGPVIPIVGSALTSERMSAFSVEDVYSNLLGAILGVQAADAPEPYNRAMTRLLNERMERAGALSLEATHEIFDSLKGDWWRPGLRSYRMVRRRNFDIGNWLEPKLPRTESAQKHCGQSGAVIPLVNPSVELATGLDFRSVAYLKAVPTKAYAKRLRSLGAELNEDGSFTRDQFPAVVEAMKTWFLKRIPESLDY